VYGEIFDHNRIAAITSNYQYNRKNGQYYKKEKKKFSEILESQTESEQPKPEQQSRIDIKS